MLGHFACEKFQTNKRKYLRVDIPSIIKGVHLSSKPNRPLVPQWDGEESGAAGVSRKPQMKDPGSSTMKKVQPQRLTNIAWVLSLQRSVAPGEINLSRNSQAEKMKKGEANETNRSGVNRRVLKWKKKKRKMLELNPQTTPKSGNSCPDVAPSCRRSFVILLWWRLDGCNTLPRGLGARPKIVVVTSSHSNHVWSEGSRRNGGAAAINSQEASDLQRRGIESAAQTNTTELLQRSGKTLKCSALHGFAKKKKSGSMKVFV